MQSICDYLISPNGTVSIRDNAPGCNSENEIEEACGNGMNEWLSDNELLLYPNPFTNSTTIEYELNEISNIQFTVYNMIGEVVYSTEEGKVIPGIHTVTWSPGHLPGGMYYAVLRSGEGVKVVKMVKQ